MDNGHRAREDGLKNRQENDIFKDNWCRDHGITLLRISYRDSDKAADIIEAFITLLPMIDIKNKEELIWSSNFIGYAGQYALAYE